MTEPWLITWQGSTEQSGKKVRQDLILHKKELNKVRQELQVKDEALTSKVAEVSNEKAQANIFEEKLKASEEMLSAEKESSSKALLEMSCLTKVMDDLRTELNASWEASVAEMEGSHQWLEDST